MTSRNSSSNHRTQRTRTTRPVAFERARREISAAWLRLKKLVKFRRNRPTSMDTSDWEAIDQEQHRQFRSHVLKNLARWTNTLQQAQASRRDRAKAQGLVQDLEVMERYVTDRELQPFLNTNLDNPNVVSGCGGVVVAPAADAVVIRGSWRGDPATLASRARSTENWMKQIAARESNRVEQEAKSGRTRRRRPTSSLKIKGRTVLVDDEPVPISMTPQRLNTALFFLRHLRRHRAQWQTGSDLNRANLGSHRIRWDRILKNLPQSIQNLIESSPNLGYRLMG